MLTHKKQMKIATWNINGIKARIDTLQEWLKQTDPDVAVLQEIKSVDEGFPNSAFEDLGYNVETHGQKSFNGVAILTDTNEVPAGPVEVKRGLGINGPKEGEGEQSRYLEADVTTNDGHTTRVVCIYLPNGNPLPGPKFDYKIAWMAKLHERMREIWQSEVPCAVVGDYNVIPEAKDVYAPSEWLGEALYMPQTRAKFQEFLGIGLTEAFAQMDGRTGQYTFWDYQRGAWQNNEGIRIDHLILSPQAADNIVKLEIHKMTRDGIKPSDHVPVIGTFDF